MEEDIEKYKKDCDLLELTDDELISEAKATLIDAMNRKGDGFRRPEKVALVAIEHLIAENKELKNKYQNIKNEINGQISIVERNYDIEELNEYAKGMYDAYKSIQNLF